MKGFKFSKFSKKQRKIFNWWVDTSPVRDKDGIIADGAIRSGKTLAMSLSFVMWAMENFDEENFGMCGKTIGSFRRNVLRPLKRMLKSRGYKYQDHRSDNMVVIQRNGTANYFYIFGGKDESSQDLIQGITLAGLFMDEVSLMPESFVNQATGRCSVAGSKLWFNCNPAGPNHFFKVDWIDKAAEKRLLHLHFTMDDNLSLADVIKERYRSMFTGVFYKRFILGIWCLAEGVIYDNFDVDKHVREYSGKVLRRYVSVDYGTQNATCFLLWELRPDGIWHCTDEYYYSGRETGVQKTDKQYADDLEKWLNGRKIKQIIVDPAAASFIAELRERHYSVRKGMNDVLDGIRVTASCIDKGLVLISPKCEWLIKELQSYAWDEKAANKGEDQPVKIFDHACDAFRYFCYTIIGHSIKMGGG